MFIYPKLYRRSVEIVASMWQTLLVTVNEKIFGIKMVYTGDAVKRHEKTIFILNHRTRLDWYFFFSYVFHSSILNRHKITLKALLKWFPGIGWAMQANNYIFLDRNWESDQTHIKRILKYQTDLNAKPNILYFPEGTDLTEETKARSHKYSKENDLPLFEYVLQPRVTGFCFFVKTLREIGGIDSVYDVTVGYPYNIVQGEKELLKGDVPKEVHFHFTKYSISELPVDEEDLEKWVLKVWEDKEERLKKFYSEPKPAQRSFSDKKIANLKPRAFLMWLSLVYWCSMTFVMFFVVLNYDIARFYAFVICLFYIVCGYFFNGVDKVEMLIYERFKPYKLWAKKPIKYSNPYDKYLKS